MSRARAPFIAATVFVAMVAEADEGHLSRLSKITVEEREGRVQVSLSGSRAPDFTSFSLSDPYRVVIDWAGSELDGIPDAQTFARGLVRRISTRQFVSEAEKISRVTIELAALAQYRFTTDGRHVVALFDIPELPPEPVAAPIAKATPAKVKPEVEPLPDGPLTEPLDVPPPPRERVYVAMAPKPALAGPPKERAQAPSRGALVAPREASPAAVVPAAAPVVPARAEPPPPKVIASAGPTDAVPVRDAGTIPPPTESVALAPKDERAETHAVVEAPTQPVAPPAPVRLASFSPRAADANSARLRPSVMTYIGFRKKSQGAEVFVRCDSVPRYRLVEEGADRVVLELSGTSINVKNNERALDTRFFQTAVTRVQAQPARSSTRVVVDLREHVPVRVEAIGTTIKLHFGSAGE